MVATKRLAVVLGLAYAMAFSLAARAQQMPDGPHYKDGMNLVRPTDYREWTFLGSSLGMTYTAPRDQQSPPVFGNVFVNPSSFRNFMQTGKWPDSTIFVLELRSSSGEGSIIKAGRFQADLVALEAEVKDSRFPDGWAFFNFGPATSLKDVTEAVPASPATRGQEESCVECHTKHTAVERTFVQFYPTLLEVARRMGTLKPGF
jgi:hypothetical protein